MATKAADTGFANAESDRELIDRLPALDALQNGHIRHIDNISRQLPNDWAHMGTRFSWQEGFESFRYQLAYMAYALGLAHFHRLPAAPGYFRKSFDGLVQKMLLPDVWYFWRETSRGGGAANFDAPRSPGTVNPVDRDNIMYSAYIQSMTAMYNYLFDDPKYRDPGALTFKFDPILFRFEERRDFVYDQDSLNEHLYWRMVESGYLGIACEPFCTFQICQQPAILGFRLHDFMKGTDRADEVTAGFERAWADFGHFDDEGRYNTYVRTHVGEVLPNIYGPWSDGWLGALLNMWKPEMVKEHYPEQMARWVVDQPDGTAYVPPVSLMEQAGADISGGSALDFGWCCMWASEVGDTELLDRFLAYSDAHMNPAWEKGGYYYPRNDNYEDADGYVEMVSPCAGNALLPYARLNVPDGLWALYNKPWSRDHFAEPLITEISDNVDVLRARYLPEQKKLVFTLAPREDGNGDARLTVANSWREGSEDWTLSANGREAASWQGGELSSSGLGAQRSDDALELVWNRDERTDFVLSWD